MDASDVREYAADVPTEPGVYQFLSYEGIKNGPSDGATAERVLYVGKAVDLRDRLRSYADPRGERIRRMLARADDVDVAVTDTETQALLLEANLIKRHQPRYNVRLKDDKSYPLVQLTAHEAPRIEITRDPEDDATVYGPFTDKGRLETVLKALRETYGLRGCSDHKFQGRDRPCLDYDIGLCTAPCTGETELAVYREDVTSVERFFEGETGVLTGPLEAAMAEAAQTREFERAANLRDRLTAVEALHGDGASAVASRTDEEQRTDVLGVALAGESATVARLHAEGGQLVERERHRLDAPEGKYLSLCPTNEVIPTDGGPSASPEEGTRERSPASETAGSREPGEPDTEVAETATAAGTGSVREAGVVLAAFITQYYAERPLPDAILCSTRPVGSDIDSWLTAEGVDLRVPGAGREATLVDLALKNARRRDTETDEPAALARALDLDRAGRIEGVDVSHAGGTEVVGSNVVFVDGEPEKTDYRRKKLPEGNDDYAAMASLVGWRAERAVAGRDDRPDPDLLVIDGGAGQLDAARDACADAGWDVPLVALAKREERVITSEGARGWDADAPQVRLLRRVRDEAHRFAVQYHETRRDGVATVLEEVPGVGPMTRKRLLRRFGSVQGVRAASRAELEGVDGVGEQTASALLRRL